MRIRQLHPQAPWGAARETLPPLSLEWVRAQFARTDSGAGGRLQTWRRELKFRVRCWWRSSALELSAASFRDRTLDAIARDRPELTLRPLRSYLRRGLDAERRARAVQAHFAWLSSRLPMPLIDRLYAGERVALLGADTPLPGLSYSLAHAAGLGREGELVLHLEWQGHSVMSMAFSVLYAGHVVSRADPEHASGPRIVIGSLQGMRGADAGLRELSAAAQRLRPSALMVLGVQALTVAWGLGAPLGVAAQSHVYSGYASRRRKVELDYDAAWAEAGAQRTGRHYWTLPALPVLRPEAEVESRRRAQHRRRNALRERVLASVQATAGGLLTRS